MEYIKFLESLVFFGIMKYLILMLNMMKYFLVVYGELIILYSFLYFFFLNLDDLYDFEKGRKCIEVMRIDYIIKII